MLNVKYIVENTLCHINIGKDIGAYEIGVIVPDPDI